MADRTRDWLTPPALARELGVKPSKVIGWIRRGDLAAVNLSERRSGRPRYRISRQAVEAFLAGRAVVPRVASPRRRRSRSPEIIRFF